MADAVLTVVDPKTRQEYALRLKDNGDGSFSLGATTTGAGGGPATIADGADVAEGAVADAVVAAGAAGSLSAKLRRLTTDLATLLTTAALQLTEATFTGRVGEVQASPTANTVLDRLKQLLTGIVLAGGTNHIGQVGGHSTSIAVTPTVSTSPAYSANDVVGGVQTLTNACRVNNGGALLQDLLVIDTSSTPQKAALDILIYSQNPNHGTYTDNAAFTLDTTDNAFLIRRLTIQASDYVTVAGVAMAIAVIPNLARVVQATGAQANLYAIAITSGTPTYGSVSALKLQYGFLPD